MSTLSLVLGCNFNQYESQGGNFEPTTFLVFDYITEKMITGNLAIASQPMQSGDTISDHYYREPEIYDVAGSFSLNGRNWNDISYNFRNKGDRLTNIEDTFDTIRKEGLLCTLYTIDTDEFKINGVNNAKSRFKIRKNMVLKSTTFTEKLNSMDFRFQFQEVIMVEQQEYEALDEATRRDLGLPSVYQPSSSSLGSVLNEVGQLAELVTLALYNNGYIEDDFINALAKTFANSNYWVYKAVCVVAAAITAASITAIASAGGVTAALGASVATGSIFPVGTAVIAGLALTALCVNGIIALCKAIDKRSKQKLIFSLTNGELAPNDARLVNLLEDVQVAVNNIDSGITVYTISQNKDQKVVLNIGGQYYQLEFTRNTTSTESMWNRKVTLLDGSQPAHIKNANWSIVSNISELNENLNCWFKDESLNYQVYMVNPSFDPNFNNTDEEIKFTKDDLTSYTIWVSQGDIQNNIRKITDAITEALESKGYKI